MSINYEEILAKKLDSFPEIEDISEDDFKLHEMINRTIKEYKEDLNGSATGEWSILHSAFVERSICKLEKLKNSSKLNNSNIEEAFKGALIESKAIFESLSEVVNSISDENNRKKVFQKLEFHNLVPPYIRQISEKRYLIIDLNIALHEKNRNPANIFKEVNIEDSSLFENEHTWREIYNRIYELLRLKSRSRDYIENSNSHDSIIISDKDEATLDTLYEKMSLIDDHSSAGVLKVSFEVEDYLDRHYNIVLSYIHFLRLFSYENRINTNEKWKLFLKEGINESAGIEELLRLDDEVESVTISPETSSLSPELKASLKILRSSIITDDESAYKTETKNQTEEYNYNNLSEDDDIAIQQRRSQKNRKRLEALDIIFPIIALIIIVIMCGVVIVNFGRSSNIMNLFDNV